MKRTQCLWAWTREKSYGIFCFFFQSFIYGPLSNLVYVTANESYQGIYIYDGNVQIQTTETEENLKNNDEERSLVENIEYDLVKENSDISENDLENTAPQVFNPSKTHITENDFKSKRKSKSRWAIKRAQQNKKPKFEFLTNFDTTFKKVQISNEELTLCIKRERDTEYYKSKKFKCEHCVLGFSDQHILVKHNRKFHEKNGKAYICDICNSMISNKRHLLSHLSKHYKVYKCIVCGFVCRKEMRLCHYENEHKNVFQCLKCKLQFGYVVFSICSLGTVGIRS